MMRKFSLLFVMMLIGIASVFAQTTNIASIHEVKKGETLYGISKHYGVSIEDIMNANPEMRQSTYVLQIGNKINIPVKKAAAKPSQPTTTTVATPTTAAKAIRVGVMLPLHNDNGDGQRMVEYVRGLLLGIDRLKKDGISVDISTWNVPMDADIRLTLLEKGANECDIIFGPLYTKQVKPLAEFCKKNNIKMVIPFSITGNDVADYSEIFQVYQSREELNESTARRMANYFGAYHIVFVDCGAGANDQNAFVSQLRQEADLAHLSFSSTQLAASEADFKDAFSRVKPNVVVLNTSRSPELNTTLAKLNKITAEIPTLKISLFGYTEWFMYTQVYQEYFFKYDTYIPSTYYLNPVSEDTKWLEANYRNWFKTEMMKAIPRFAITGFDHACFFIGGYNKYGVAFTGAKGQSPYKAVQTPLKFESAGKGWKNCAFMFIHYTNKRTIESVTY